MSCILSGILPLQSQSRDKKEGNFYQICTLDTSQTRNFLKLSGKYIYRSIFSIEEIYMLHMGLAISNDYSL